MKLRLGYLYPDLMNIYADRGNVDCLRKRCQWRGIGLEIERIGLNCGFDAHDMDLLFVGGGQDRQQQAASKDLAERTGSLVRQAVDRGSVLLAVCGGYQLMGNRYVAADGSELPGIGLFDAETRHPGFHVPRCVGNVVARWQRRLLVGFENHGGRTFLGPQSEPLARVVTGAGNNGDDGDEGARSGLAFGTYLHGSLLPKNPHFADFLLEAALQRNYPGVKLEPLDDSEEWAAHRAALAKAGVRD